MNEDSNADQGEVPKAGPRPVAARLSVPKVSTTSSPTHPLPRVEGRLARPAPPAARPGTWRYTFSSLGNRNYLYLWLGMLSLEGGFQMQMLARAYLVYDITGSASLLGLVSAGAGIPMLFLAMFGGAIADRVKGKRVIQVGQGAFVLIALLIGVAITTGAIEWYHLMAAAVIQGSMFAFMAPARYVLIPRLVGRDKLTNAVALHAAAMSAMTLTAPAVSGVLYALIGPDKVYYIISGLSIVAISLTTLIPEDTGPPTKAKRRMAKDILAGLSYVRRSPLLLTLLVMALVTTLLASPFRFLMPLFVVDVYHRGPDSMGLLVAIMGAGALVGSLFIASLGSSRRGLLLILGSFMSGIALLVLALFPFYFAAVAIMMLLGLGDSGRRSLNQSLLLEQSEDQYKGRVMSLYMMNFGLLPLGVLPAGIVADALGGQAMIGILAGLLLTATLAITVTQKRLRDMP